MLIACAVALALGVLEAFTRKVLVRQSKDLHRCSQHEARGQALMARSGPHLVFIGNSLTDRGIDPKQAEQHLGVATAMLAADSSHIDTWYWMLSSVFWKHGKAPEFVVINYYGRSLEDGQRLDVGRLAQFFTDSSDWRELFATEVKGLDERAELIVSTAWATYAFRERIKERVFGLIPGYTDYATSQNAVNRSVERVSEESGTRTWLMLGRLLARAKQHGTMIVFVAFPMRGEKDRVLPYEPSPQNLEAIAKAGMIHVDLRRVPELDPAKHYDDDIHLNAEGRKIYTERLAAELRAILK